MMMADMNNRWVYKGSVTTPPCAENVYWNVLRTVYPLKQRHLDQFKNQLKRHKGLLETGNYREIQPLIDQNPMIISTSAVENHGLLVATIILAIAVATLICLAVTMNRSVVATNEEITKLQAM